MPLQVKTEEKKREKETGMGQDKRDGMYKYNGKKKEKREKQKGKKLEIFSSCFRDTLTSSCAQSVPPKKDRNRKEKMEKKKKLGLEPHCGSFRVQKNKREKNLGF